MLELWITIFGCSGTPLVYTGQNESVDHAGDPKTEAQKNVDAELHDTARHYRSYWREQKGKDKHEKAVHGSVSLC